MSQQYKRSICKMCPTETQCLELRWSTYCGTCPRSLQCVSGAGIGNVDCPTLRAAWRDLPRKCLVAAGIVHRKIEGVDPELIQAASAPWRTCPRCGQARGTLEMKHSLTDFFKRQTICTFTCDYCGVDEEVKVR